MHPAVAKATALANLAIEYEWKGHLDSQPDQTGEIRYRRTTLTLTRNDEEIRMDWANQKLAGATYSIFDCEPVSITSKKQLLGFIKGWPNLMELFAAFPNMNRPKLVEQYRKLPFDMDDSDDKIIDSLIGRKIYWYNRELSKIESDTVGKRTKRFRIQPIGHRKLLHCVCIETNFRSILLDQLIQVGR